MKIIELFLDPESIEGGVDAIALVDKPAHESNFLTFTQEDPTLPPTDLTFIGEMFEMEEQVGLAKSINQLGTPTGIMEMMGWVIESIEPVVSLEQELKLFEGAVTAEPNQPSMADLPNRRVRYKYIKNPQSQGDAIIPTSRDFCREMIRYDRVFRIEDIRKMTEDCANDQFGCYDIFTWRGSYNCRHLWMKVVYRPVGPITGRQRPLEEGAPAWNQPSTQVQQRAILVEEQFGILAMIDGQPLFSSKEDALKLAQLLGCEGYHEHKVGDYVGYMACETHEFQSYNDYPQSASDAACKVLGWIEKYGRDEVEGMERTGLARANQLCNREPISVDTIARMASFARHKQNSKIAPEFEGTPWKDKGYVAWEGWGSDEGIEWAQRKLEEIRNEMGIEEDMLYDNPCQEGYIAYGTKEKDGVEVPNCIPEEMCWDCGGAGVSISGVPTGFSEEGNKYGFSYDDDKMEITGAAIIPNRMIIRRNPITEELYYVFFSQETTKLLSEKFMESKKMDQTNINHTEIPAPETFVTESWLVDDPKVDKSYALGLEYPTGTWVVTMKVKNRKFWEDIKQGKYRGYSIEGYFNERVVFS